MGADPITDNSHRKEYGMRWALLGMCLWMTNAAGADDSFKPLFDGKTLAGWEGNKAYFRIEEGAIVAGTLKEKIPRNEFLCTTKEYGNFELRLQVKLVGQGANGGVQFRSQRVPNHNEVKGYQADMAERYWGRVYDESRRGRFLTELSAEEQQKLVKANDWNEYVIRCEGRHIQLWLNGRQTADYTETDESIPQTGIIGVQIHAGQPAEASYKDIRIWELP
jgi:hypothetical protein